MSVLHCRSNCKRGTERKVHNIRRSLKTNFRTRSRRCWAIVCTNSSAQKQRRRRLYWVLPWTSRSSTLHAWVPRDLRWFRWARPLAGLRGPPKWHLMLHIGARAGFSGNPHFHTTFLDEDWNGRVAKLAAGCHRMTWHKRVLAGFRYA